MFTTTTWRGGEKWQKSLNFLKFALLMRTPVRVRVCSRGEEAFAWHILEAFLTASACAREAKKHLRGIY